MMQCFAKKFRISALPWWRCQLLFAYSCFRFLLSVTLSLQRIYVVLLSYCLTWRSVVVMDLTFMSHKIVKMALTLLPECWLLCMDLQPSVKCWYHTLIWTGAFNLNVPSAPLDVCPSLKQNLMMQISWSTWSVIVNVTVIQNANLFNVSLANEGSVTDLAWAIRSPLIG